MSNKIWNFDILVDDCFVNFNTKKMSTVNKKMSFQMGKIGNIV